MSEPCPCGSGSDYATCCGPLHAGAPATTAEALMRSRYCAFARRDADYLVRSWHPSRRSETAEQLRQHFGDTIWEGLEILEQDAGGAGEDSGTVTFCAHYRNGAHSGELHERSRFLREAGHWFYVDGDPLPAVRRGRNDRCWCGSGRKFKQCHGR